MTKIYDKRIRFTALVILVCTPSQPPPPPPPPRRSSQCIENGYWCDWDIYIYLPIQFMTHLLINAVLISVASIPPPFLPFVQDFYFKIFSKPEPENHFSRPGQCSWQVQPAHEQFEGWQLLLQVANDTVIWTRSVSGGFKWKIFNCLFHQYLDLLLQPPQKKQQHSYPDCLLTTYYENPKLSKTLSKDTISTKLSTKF